LPVAKKGKISTAGHTKDFGQPKKGSVVHFIDVRLGAVNHYA
jgi:hypothetical protein